MRMKTNNHVQLENSVQVLCELIEQKKRLKNTISEYSEYSLRRELVACILGSQVKYEMAKTALSRLENAGLLTDKWWYNLDDQFETLIVKELSSSYSTADTIWCYRFPKSRARQLAKARDAIATRTLSERVSSGYEPQEIRRQLIAEIAGIGPKQASMFLRNTGISYDLAILDTHVLHFLNMKKVLSQEQMKVPTLAAYEKIEGIVIQYAESLGYPVGYLDLAIWATMRAARELSR